MVLLGFNRSPMRLQTFNKLKGKYQSFFTTVRAVKWSPARLRINPALTLADGRAMEAEKMPP
jgi:hypothetical protein